MANLPLGWLQLKKQPLRLVVALSGVSFAVILVLMQLGFRESMFESAVRYHKKLRYDVVLVSPKSPFIVQLRTFPRQRLYQTMALDEVDSVAPVYIRLATWKSPGTHDTKAIYVVAFDPSHDALEVPGVVDLLSKISERDVLLFDSESRPEYGDVVADFRTNGSYQAELNNRRFRVAGLFDLGLSFGIDGSVVMSDTNFRRIFPDRPANQIDLGLVRVREGVDAEQAVATIRAHVPKDVLVLTKDQFVRRERSYWAATTPIGYILGFGLVVGLVVGSIIVYQILFADVSDHSAEYATLKAMGYSNGFLSRVVLQQAVVLGVLGYVPGLLISLFLYGRASAATNLPLQMTVPQAIAVFFLTVVMCGVSGILALRRVWTTDPADVF